MDGFMLGIDGLADSYPLFKARLLKSCSMQLFDSVATPMEKEFVNYKLDRMDNGSRAKS